MSTERITIPGGQLVDKVRQLLVRKDVRSVCLIHEERRLMLLPAGVGDPGAPANVVSAPVLAAIGAFSALVNECTVEIEKKDQIQTGFQEAPYSPARRW